MTDVQPALPDLDLPDHHGHKPIGMRTKVNGAGSRITRPHEIGDTLILVAEVAVGDAGHTKTKDGLVYVEKFSVQDLYEIEGQSGRRLLEGLRQQYRIADDERSGRKSLPGVGDAQPVLGPKGWTDASGRLLDEEELAEIRGDAVLSAVNDPNLDPLTLVMADGSKVQWPADFPSDAGGPPQIGEFFGDLQVREVIDADGQTLAEWTSEMESARLDRLEAEVAAREDADAAMEAMGPRNVLAVASDTSGWDAMTVPQIVRAVRVVDDVEALRAAEKYELAVKNRKTVLAALTARIGELSE